MSRALTIKASPTARGEPSFGSATPATAGPPELPVPAETKRAIAVNSPHGTLNAPTAGGAEHRPRLSLTALSFAIVVVLPLVVAAVYYFLIASDQYVVEFRFAVRSADPAPAQFGAWLPATATAMPAADDSYAVVQYIRSRAIVDDLGPTLDLRAMFSTRQADWLARLHLPASVEQLVQYWRGQVDAFFDASTGTIVVQVYAFSRHDALALARHILSLSERLVNQLSARARENALHDSEGEVARAQWRLSHALAELRDYRDKEGLVDANRAANSTEELADRVRNDLVGARTELLTLRRYMGEDAPSVKLLEARIQSLSEQYRVITNSVTSPVAAPSPTLSRVMGQYEELDSERQFAERAYQHALEARDQSRLNADRQQVYIADFVPPQLPEEALFPHRARSLAIVFLIAFSVWAIGGLTVRSVRDHL